MSVDIKAFEPLKDYPAYEINRLGQIRIINTGVLKSCAPNGGYPLVRLYRNDRGKQFRVHRLVARQFIVNTNPKFTLVNHRDGNKLNYRADNLEWTNASGNSNHAVAAGLLKRKKKCRRVIRIDKNGVETVFASIKDVNLQSEITLRQAVKTNGKRLFRGFFWKYESAEPDLAGELWSELPTSEHWSGYTVSTMGRVRNKKTGRLICFAKHANGYLTVAPFHDQHQEYRTALVHRMVAMAFCKGRSETNNIVNHMNGDRSDNRSDNLEWVSYAGNMQHASKTVVEQLDLLDGHVIATFASTSVAADAVDCFRENIATAASGRTKSCAGYAWRFVLKSDIGVKRSIPAAKSDPTPLKKQCAPDSEPDHPEAPPLPPFRLPEPDHYTSLLDKLAALN